MRVCGRGSLREGSIVGCGTYGVVSRVAGGAAFGGDGASVVDGALTDGELLDEPEARSATNNDNAPVATTPATASARVVNEIFRIPMSRSPDRHGATPRQPPLCLSSRTIRGLRKTRVRVPAQRNAALAARRAFDRRDVGLPVRHIPQRTLRAASRLSNAGSSVGL